jgi:hypothetical protein
MQQPELDENDNLGGSTPVELAETAGGQGGPNDGEAMAKVATVAVVGIGAALFEAALLPGMVLGVAAMWLPRYYPKIDKALKPLFRTTVRGVNTANAALNVVDFGSRAVQLTRHLSRRRR